VVVQLNPCHEDNYYQGNALLTWGGAVAEGNELLKRATDCLPPGWKAAARPSVDCMYSLVVGGATGKVRRFNVLYRGAERLARSHDLDSVYETLKDLLHVAAPSRVFPARRRGGLAGQRDHPARRRSRSWWPRWAGPRTRTSTLFRPGGRVHPFDGAVAAGPGWRQARKEAAVGTRPLPVRLVALTVPARRYSRRSCRQGSRAGLMESAVPVRQR
jgi:hypothetical protein